MNQYLTKTETTAKNLKNLATHTIKTKPHPTKSLITNTIIICVLFFATHITNAATYYTRGAGGNWGTAATWSTVGCNGAAATTVPGPFDDVIICNSNGASAVTVTVNGNYSCNSLTIGTGAANATVQTSNAAYALTVAGALTFNTGNGAGVYTLNVSTGTCTIGGAVVWNTVNGTNRFTISTGTLNFTQSVAILNANQQITLSGTGKVYFNGDFSDAQNKLTTFSGCNIYFAGNYSAATTNAVWNTGAYANFTGTNKTITATSNITFGYVTVQAGASVSNVSDAGTLTIARDFTLGTLATFTVNKALTVQYSVTLGTSANITLNDNLTIARNWVNNGGTLTGNGKTVTFTGYGYTIGGSSATDFPAVVIGIAGSAARFGYTQNANITCTSLTLESNSSANTSAYTLGTGNPTIAISGDLTIKQLTSTRSNSFYVNGGTCTVAGKLVFSGTDNTTTMVTQVVVTSGTFTLTGLITWLAQTGTAAVVTEVISVTTGTVTFVNPISMPRGSGSVRVTGTGTINFNGTAATSLDLNGTGTGSTAAVLSAAAGSTINFKNGFTNASALTFTAGSNQNFTGTGTITPTASIRFGHINIASGATLTLAGAIALQNTWVDNGTFVPATFIVTFNGSSTTTQSITKAGGETFYGLSLASASATLTLNNDVTATNSLAMSGHNINLNGYTLQVGNGAANTLTRSAGIIYGGNFRRYWPATAITNNSGSNYGLFPIGSASSYRPITIASTVSPTVGGYITASHNNQSTVTETSFTEGGFTIQRVSNQSSTLSSTGITGGTYSLNVAYGNFNSAGSVADLRLEVNNGGSYSAVGTHATTSGTAAAPTVRRTGLTLAQLNNTFVAGTRAKITTPIVAYYYSRGATGNWSSPTAWSTTAGGAGASCTCVPPAASYVMICAGQTMTMDVDASIEFISIENGAVLDGVGNLTVNREMYLNGTGKIMPLLGTWALTDVYITGNSVSVTAATTSVSGNLTIPSAASFSINAPLSLTGDLTVNGTLNVGATTLTLSGSGTKVISGTGAINGAGGTISVTNADKSISAGSSLTIQPTISLANGITLTNNGTVTLTGNIVGGNNSSTWVNAAGARLNTSGTILSTGTLTASAATNYINYNGSGAQTIKATTYDNLLCSNAGTKTVAANFAVTDALTISGAAIVDEGTFTISGAADLVMSGTTELKLQRSANNTYPELTGTYSLSGGTVTINQTANMATLQAANYYNLKFTGTRPYNMVDVATITNDFLVESSSTLTNLAGLQVGGTLNYATGGSSTLAGDIAVGNLTISNGTFSDGGNDITLTGANFTNNGGTFTTTGNVIFAGSATQYITGSNATTFSNLVINNSGSTGVTLSKPVTVSGFLNLEDGYVYTTSTNILTIADGATASSGLAGSYVRGPLSKIGNDAFIFPIGDGGKLGPMAINAPTSAATNFTAEYRLGGYGNYDNLTAPLKKVSSLEHWLLERTGSSDAITISLYWGSAAGSGINDCGDLRIAHWNGSSWIKEAATTSGSCAGAGSITTLSGLSSFSPFTFGSEREQMATNPLPIELLSFDAKLNGDAVAIKWATATEENNHYFTVEKSTNGIVFEELKRIEGAGNSNTIRQYATVDENPFTGYSYYRLKQTDFNGDFTYSDMAVVHYNKVIKNAVTVYPNPLTEGNFNLKLNTEIADGTMDMAIYTMQGMQVFAATANVVELQANGFYQLPIKLAKGMYTLKTIIAGYEQYTRLIVID